MSSFILPVLLVLVAVVLLVVLMTAVRNYIKVPPNKVAVFYGRKHQTPDGKLVGFRLVTGGAGWKWPVLENVTYLDLSVFPIDLDVRDVPNIDGVLVSVQAVANVKIRSDEQSLTAAAERFLGSTPAEIKQIAYKNLEGHLRSIVGRLTVEEIVRDRSKFNQEVLTEATSDLAKIGLGVDVLTIQKVSDSEGYIEALGKKRTAEVKRDAQIGEANAAREATIQSTTSLREGKEKENENLALVALAEKERDVRKATYEADVLSQQATAKQSGPLADARARQQVIEQEVMVELVRTRKQTEVAEADALKREKQLLSEVVKPSEAQKKQIILQAEASPAAGDPGGRGQEVRDHRDRRRREAAARDGRPRPGRRAAVQAPRRSRGKQGEAPRRGRRKQGQAPRRSGGNQGEAAGRGRGSAEKAEAFAKLDDSARALLVLERFPEIIKAFAPVAGAVAAPLGNIDKLVMIDSGGSGDGNGTVNRLASTVPTTMFQVMQAAQALGLDMSVLLGKLGIKAEEETKGGKKG